MAGSIDGLVSGLDTTTIVTQLMQLERQPQVRLQRQQSSLQQVLTSYRSLNTSVSSIKDAAAKLTAVHGWEPAKATSSNKDLVSVSASAGAAVGSVTFTVRSLATAAAAVTAGSTTSRDTVVADGPILLSKGVSRLGLSAVDQGATLAAGAHTLTVTQSSSAATKSGSVPLGATTTVSAGVNDTLDVEIDGVATSLALGPGDYTPDQLAAEVTRASAGALTASVGSDGALRLVRTAEGSAATLRVTADNQALGLTADPTAIAGIDGKVRLGDASQPELTVSSVTAGQTLVVSDSAGNSVVVTASGGLRAGEASLHNVDVAAGATLAQVGEALNKAKAGVTAAVVEVSTGSYRLQLTSTTTGASSALMLDPDAFTPESGLGALQTLGEGRDAVLTIGSGPGAYEVTRSSNTITGLLAGTTLTLTKADPETPVKVDVVRDAESMASQVSGMVSAVNAALAQIKGLTKYDPTTKTAGLLMSDGMVRRISSDLVQAITGSVVGGALTSASAAGITVTRDGSISFDKTKFLDAYAKDPAAVEALLGAGTEDDPGIAGRTEALVTRLTKAGDGLIPSAIKTREREIQGFDQRIASWDSRLEIREAALRKQFSAMETALGKMQQQSSWLAGQLAGLSNNWAGNS